VARVTAFWHAVRRARASVRVRVTVLAAGAFAVTVLIAATLLVKRLESTLVDDLRADSEAVLSQQMLLVGEQGLPAAQVIRTDSGEIGSYYADGRMITFALPEGMTPDEFNTLVTAGSGGQARADASLQIQALGGAAAGAGAAVNDVVAAAAPVGPGFLAVASPLDEVRDTIAAATRLLWIVGPLLVALVAVLAWILAGRALRPVRLLTARVASIESGSLHERVPEPPSNDEIAELAHTMNEMLGRLDAANESSRRLVSDASHELRTPIAVMRTELEVARRDAANDWDDTSDVVVGELDRLALLVDDLLLLARGQERALSRQRVELVDLVHDVATRRRRADIDIEVVVAGVADDAVVDGDRVAIERALDHLVTNAARSARSRVIVTVERVTIHVDDDGPGIPVEHRCEVVRRFVRLDEARTRDAGGSGLGLAVASDVAAAHGGALAIGDSPLGGARVTLRLADAPPAISPEGAALSSVTMGP
jgi:signal transduction histidine kinase